MNSACGFTKSFGGDISTAGRALSLRARGFRALWRDIVSAALPRSSLSSFLSSSPTEFGPLDVVPEPAHTDRRAKRRGWVRKGVVLVKPRFFGARQRAGRCRPARGSFFLSRSTLYFVHGARQLAPASRTRIGPVRASTSDRAFFSPLGRQILPPAAFSYPGMGPRAPKASPPVQGRF